MKKYIAAGSLALLSPLVALAQSPITTGTQTVTNLANSIRTILGYGITLLIILATLYFLWGVFKYVIEPEEKDKARTQIVWGLIGLAVMVSVWGLVRFLTDSFGLTNETSPANTPKLPSIN